jgi:serine/threonine protein kinase
MISHDLTKIKIADFNVSKKFENKSMMTKTGVEEWQAPEMIINS